MTATLETRTPSHARRWLWTGLSLTVLVTVASFMGSSVIADHVQAGYPAYGRPEVASATTAYLVILGVVAAVGALGWLGTLWATRSGGRWVPWLATLLFLGALAVAVVGLTTPDTSGDVGLAPLVGWLQLVPCVAGGLAVAALWRRR